MLDSSIFAKPENTWLSYYEASHNRCARKEPIKLPAVNVVLLLTYMLYRCSMH